MYRLIPVRDLSDPHLSVYTGMKESQLRHIYEPAEGLFICESLKVIQRALNAGYDPVSFLIEEQSVSREAADLLTHCENVPVYTAPLSVLTKLTGYYLTGGILCAMRRRPLPAPQILEDSRFSRIAVLEDIENPTNVGAIFRSAAAMQMDYVLLTEGCADPLYRRSARVSMGCVFQIPWTRISSSGYIEFLQKLRFRTAAFALSDRSISVDDPCLKKEDRLAVILGNENSGLSPETLQKSDYVVRIPMAEGVDSLNVAAASAVAFWELRSADSGK